MVGGKKPDQQWNAADAGQRDGVGQIHRGHGLSAGREKADSNSLSSTPNGESNELSEAGENQRSTLQVRAGLSHSIQQLAISSQANAFACC